MGASAGISKTRRALLASRRVDQRDEVLHKIERAKNQEAAHAAAHSFVRWMEELDKVTRDAAMQAFTSPGTWNAVPGIAGSAPALELIAAHPDGCTKAILAAESIPADVLIELVQSGLAIARSERIDEEDGVRPRKG
jgi:hypothetical protein